jgi:hypothetical protein
MYKYMYAYRGRYQVQYWYQVQVLTYRYNCTCTCKYTYEEKRKLDFEESCVKKVGCTGYWYSTRVTLDSNITVNQYKYSTTPSTEQQSSDGIMLTEEGRQR